jgi:hypothetical protein
MNRDLSEHKQKKASQTLRRKHESVEKRRLELAQDKKLSAVSKAREREATKMKGVREKAREERWGKQDPDYADKKAIATEVLFEKWPYINPSMERTSPNEPSRIRDHSAMRLGRCTRFYDAVCLAKAEEVWNPDRSEVAYLFD